MLGAITLFSIFKKGFMDTSGRWIIVTLTEYTDRPDEDQHILLDIADD